MVRVYFPFFPGLIQYITLKYFTWRTAQGGQDHSNWP